MATSYVTPGMLAARPAGVSWKAVPTLTASADEQEAQLAQVCWTATSIADTYCQQPLRAVVNTELRNGPGEPRLRVDRGTGRATLVTRRWPVIEVNAVQLSPASAFPSQWSLVPAGQCRVKHPVLRGPGGAPVTGPSGGNAVDVAPGWVRWDLGRCGWDVLISYTSGYPHAGLTADAAAGDTQVHVDDVTGWAGWSGFAYDGVLTETVRAVSAVATAPVTLEGAGGAVQAGPGTLALASPLLNDHPAGTVISALPANAIHGVVLKAATQALEAIDAIATQSLNGQMAGGTGALAEEAELLLDPFRRVI